MIGELIQEEELEDETQEKETGSMSMDDYEEEEEDEEPTESVNKTKEVRDSALALLIIFTLYITLHS